MNVLSNGEVSAWLIRHGIQEAPYSRGASREEGGYEQVAIPPQALSQSHLAENLLLAIEPFESALLHITDWAHYIPQQMATFQAVRASRQEKRSLIDAPGHCFGTDERDLLAGMFGLSMHYGWSAYLYVEQGPTFLNWEGELLDVWIPEGNHEHLLRAIEPFKKDDG
jgi:hypothetical protein